MARPPFSFERNTLGSNGSFALRFIAGPPFGSFEERTPFYSIAPRMENACCSAPHLKQGSAWTRLWRCALLRGVDGSFGSWLRDNVLSRFEIAVDRPASRELG